MRIDITDDDGFAELRRRLHEIRLRAQNVIPAWEVFADHLVRINREQFASRGVRYGTRWPRLAPNTVVEKARQAWPAQPLVRTTQLMRSLTVRPLGVERLLPHEADLGTRDRTAAFHHRGTSRMPARPLLSARRIAAEDVATRAVRDWIIDGEGRV